MVIILPPVQGATRTDDMAQDFSSVKPLTPGRSPGWMGRADPGDVLGQDAEPTVQTGGGAVTTSR
jgi:hypothetical protein